MNVNEMILVSVDDHVVEPPDMFDGHLAERYRSVAPHVEQTANGDDVGSVLEQSHRRCNH